MRPRLIPALCLALLLLGLAAASGAARSAAGPAPGEATFVMTAQSLWHDRDLTWDNRDLPRAYRVWDPGPTGLLLFTPDGGRTMHYGAPFAAALAAVPFYALLGVPGFAVFNMALFLLMVGAALAFLEDEGGLAALFTVLFFFASAAFAYVFLLGPQVFTMACVFFALLLWRRQRFAGAGLLIAAAASAIPWTAMLALPILLDLAFARRWRGLLTFAAPALLAFALLAVIQWRLTGTWNASGGAQRRTFTEAFPLETPRDVWRGGPKSVEGGRDLGAALRRLPRNLGYFLAGRHTGLLPYFPFALLALALFPAAPRDRGRLLLLLSLTVFVLGTLLALPNGWHGGSGGLGNGLLAAVYPAFFFLPGRYQVRRGLVPACAAAGLWTAGALVAAIPGTASGEDLQAQASTRSFRLLPLELTLLGDLPGYGARTFGGDGGALWIAPRRNFSLDEANPKGVWVRGASRSDVVLVAPEPIESLRFRVHSLSEVNELTLDTGADRLRIVFDTEGKRAGAPVELAVEPAARQAGVLPGRGEEYVYRLTLTTTDGVVPSRRNRKAGDSRNLGVFLEF